MGQGEESWVARTCHGEIVQELPSRGIKDLHRAGGHDGPISIFEIGDAAGQLGQCQRIGPEIHLAIAVPDRQRWAAPGADQEVVLAGEQEGQSEGAVEPRQGLCHACCGDSPCARKCVARVATASVSVSVWKT